jgi:hypothetical protein
VVQHEVPTDTQEEVADYDQLLLSPRSK